MNMSATLPASSFGAAPPSSLWDRIKRRSALLPIILLHIAAWFALQSGMTPPLHTMLPREIFATIITPEKPQTPLPLLPVEPKTVPLTVPLPPLPAIEPVVIATPAPTPAAVPAAAMTEPQTAPAPQAPAAPAYPKTISSGVEYLQAPQPDYPPMSRRLGEEGKVMLRVLVSDKGRPERVEIQKSSGVARLDEAARIAVMRALFKPFIDEGKAVAVYAIVPISFQLNN